MAVRIKLRRDTSANWGDVNPVLAEGEIGIELDTNNFKIGNGSSEWNSLSYVSTSGDSADVSVLQAGIVGTNKTTTFEDDLVSEVITAKDTETYKEEVWNVDNYPLSVKVHKSTDGGSNYFLQGESIINYNPEKQITGHTWWSTRSSDDYTDLIKAHFYAGAEVLESTNWDNFVEADDIGYFAESKEAMEMLADSDQAKDPITDTVNAMDAISSRETARTVIGLNTTLFNTIASKSMAIGKFVAGHADLTPSDYADIDAVLTSDTAVSAILDTDSALEVIDNSDLARETAANTSEFTIDLAYHENGLEYVLNSDNFISEIAQVQAASEHLIDTDFAREKLYAHYGAFEIFISNSPAMNVICSYTTSSSGVYEDSHLFGKVLDSPNSRQIAFQSATFMGNFVYYEPGVDQLLTHDDATTDVVDYNVAMEAVTSDSTAFTKFVNTEGSSPDAFEKMIYSEVANNWISQSSTAITVLHDSSPTTVPTLSGATDETVFASSYYSERPPYHAFDGDGSTWWETEGGNVTDEYIGYEFDSNVWCYEIDVFATDTSACLKNCKVQYYDQSDSTWKDATDVFTVDQQDSSTQKFTVCHPVKSNQWRLFVLDNYGSSLRIELTTLQFYCK